MFAKLPLGRAEVEVGHFWTKSPLEPVAPKAFVCKQKTKACRVRLKLIKIGTRSSK